LTKTGNPYLEGENSYGACCIFIGWEEYIVPAAAAGFESVPEAKEVGAIRLQRSSGLAT
jgi:hypothetical protein